MAIRDTILAFIDASVGIRYWYLTRRKGRYSFDPAKFKSYADLYGNMHLLLVKSQDEVIAAAKSITQEKLPDSTIAHAKDLVVLLETCAYFSAQSQNNAPPSIFEEIFALLEDVIVDNKVADINEYLKVKGLKVTQAFIDLCGLNGIKIDPAFLEVPIPAKKEPPLVIIQYRFGYGLTDEEAKHPLFELPYVVPYLNWFMDPSPTDTVDNAPENAALSYATIIKFNHDKFMTANPQRTFKWAFWPQNFGFKKWPVNNPIDNRPFYHDKDKLADGTNFIFTQNGRTETRAYMVRFFAVLAAELRKSNIPDPLYMDADYEQGVNVSPPPSIPSSNWNSFHAEVMNDPRATTEKIDGIQTYAEFMANLKGIDGQPVPPSEYFPYVYDTSKSNTVHMYSSLGAMVVDYGLWDTLYQPAKAVWPNVKCGNFATFGATRAMPVNGWRFRESPVDLNTNFRGDYQVPVNYCWGPLDPRWLNTIDGYMTWDEAKRRFGVTFADPIDYNVAVKQMNLGWTEFVCKGCQLANPNKPVALWFSYQYDGTHNYSGDNMPEGATASLTYDKAHVMDHFRVMNKYNVAAVGFFNPDGGIPMLDKIYDAVAHLGDAGYNAPTTSA